MQNVKSKNSLQSEFPNKNNLSQKNWQTLEKYVGTFPFRSGFLKDSIVISELKRILGSDYDSYLKHVALSGCGKIVQNGKILISDISQLHVGGYESIILLNISKQKGYLFWLSSTVSKKDFKIYGDKPVPYEILEIIVNNLNEGWGHVANFVIENKSIKIDLK
jgi:hypothetical protein